MNTTMMYMLLISLLQCGVSDSHVANDSVSPIELNGISICGLIKQDFRLAGKSFSQSDSCFFVVSTTERYCKMRDVSIFSMKEFQIHHGYCPELIFNFSVVRNAITGKLYFTGLFDLYDLIFLDGAQGTVIKYQNEQLAAILNDFVAEDETLYESERFLAVKTILLNIFSGPFEATGDVNSVLFHKTISFSDLKKRYRNTRNAKQFDEMTSFAEDNSFILENDFFGAIAFKFVYNDDKTISVYEFLLPKIERLHQTVIPYSNRYKCD